MADPLTIVGGIAAIIQIADAFTHLTSKLRFCVRTIRHAPHEIQSFQLELSNFSANLYMFYETSELLLQELEDSPEKERKKEHIVGIIKECRAVKDGFEELLSRCFSQPAQLPSLFRHLERMRWYFQKPLVAGLRLSLESAKSSVLLYVMLHFCANLQKKICELQRDLKEIPEDLKRKLRSTKQQLRVQVKATKDARKRLNEYLEEEHHPFLPPLIPDIRPILSDTRAAEHHATRGLRRESRKIRQALSSSRQSQDSQSRNSLLGSRHATRRPYGPRSSPSNPNSIGIPVAEITGFNAVHNTHYRPTPEYSPQSSIVIESSQIRKSSTAEQAETGSIELNPPIQLPIPTPPKTIGPIIHDDGEGIHERVGEWRTEASEFISDPTDSIHSVAETASSLSSLWERDAEHTVNIEKELAREAQPPISAGSSPFKAVPPFVDEDWKGIRRRPFT